MRVLLDENVPEPLHAVLARLLRPRHEVDHVAAIAWRGKKDVPLLRDARRRGYAAFVTNDVSQYDDPDECDAIRRSGLHHVTYQLPASGLDGLALASAALCASLRALVDELDVAGSQRLARIRSFRAGTRRYEITDPATRPPSNYWR
ncbi:DUF5615 family PIN-like protein [Cellulomonas sp. PS-H5]|uniref:PIN-like domain-containing protein n=1 Tax=Cellulomonas sp. PS-H5 TaxID=2820400 RepID=UPI001C4E3A67|nr:DUF5615 family PIN-like protein [Cellulomonas sp. PS-H5]MBW0252562.1 DUF5615 family PIN-like protein [Cellulomonas sp. PS-H5]